MNKMVLFTHDDLDGAGCAVVFNAFNYKHLYKVDSKEFDPSAIEKIYCSNGNVDSKVKEYINSKNFNKNKIELIFADICPGPTVIPILIDGDISIKIFDHHITNKWVQEIIPDSVVISTDNNCCGTSLLYDYFCSIAKSFKDHNMLIDNFVDTVRSYDTYEWKKTNNKSAQELNKLFDLLGMDNFVDEYSRRMSYIYPYVSNKYGTDIIRNEHSIFVDYALQKETAWIESITSEDVITKNIKGFRCAIKYLNDDDNVSELGNQFLIKYSEYDTFIGIYMNFKVISYRSRDMDCAKEFAVPMGGGGHEYAAGNPLSKETIQEITDIIFQKLLQSSGDDEKN